MFKNVLILLSAALLLGSCNVLVAPPFTTVEKMANVNNGMTSSQVATTLGIPPYDIYNMQGDGSTIHVFNYVHKQRRNRGCRLLMMDFYNKEENLTTGSSYYTNPSRPSKIYVLYQDGKVSSFITSSGRKDAEMLLIQNNTIQLIAKTNRTSFVYEKLEAGQVLVPLNSQGGFDDSRLNEAGGILQKKRGCLPF